MRGKILLIMSAILLIAFGLFKFTSSPDKQIIFMATTTIEDSGFLAYIMKKLEKDTGYSFKTMTAGTGKVLRMAKDGNADVLLVHDPKSEKEFINAGYATKRIPVFYNDFILVGPKDSFLRFNKPASMMQAFKEIRKLKMPFISRGDLSGTHHAEMKIWNANTEGFSGQWYKKTGAGMGASLNIALNTDGYIFVDRASWVSFNNKKNHQIIFEDKTASELQNIYSLIILNFEKFPHTSLEVNEKIIKWFKAPKNQQYLNMFFINDQSLYFSFFKTNKY